MELTNIRDLFRNKEAYENKKITVGGWVRSIRNSKAFGFIVVNDGTFFEPLQVVFSETLSNFEEVKCRCGGHRYRNTCADTGGKTAV